MANTVVVVDAGAAPKRHVSRWQLDDRKANGSQVNSLLSLRYLNEFVGKLKCSSNLLQHQLFPDAKEVTESMGLFNAVRRYMVTSRQSKAASISDKPDGIIVVGDGNTPRTAALFAYRMRDWKCFSVDPAMEKNSSERSKAWNDISNLVVIKNKIENVHIVLRKAILVLVHAHVTLEQALGAIDAEEIVGLITLPCCNWYGEQERLFQRHPDLVYDDFSILSDHRELRLWVGQTPPNAAIFQKMDMSCIKKVFDPTIGQQATANGKDQDGNQAIVKRKQDLTKLLQLLQGFPPAMDQKRFLKEQLAKDQTQYLQALEWIQNHIMKQHDRHGRVLLLNGVDGQHTAKCLLQSGFSQVFTLGIAENDQDQGKVALKQLSWITSDEQDRAKLVETVESCVDVEEKWMRLEEPLAPPAIPEAIRFDWILDVGFLYRAFVCEAKSTNRFLHFVKFFERLLRPEVGRFVSVTPKKQLKKAIFLANQVFPWHKQPIGSHAVANTRLFVHECSCQAEADAVASVSNGAVHGASSELWDLMKRMQRVYAKVVTKQLRESALGWDHVDQWIQSPTNNTSGQPPQHHQPSVLLVGDIVTLRKFSHGLVFITFVSPPSQGNIKIQALVMEKDFVAADPISSALLDSETFWQMIKLMKRGVRIEVVGTLSRNERGGIVLTTSAFQIVQHEFQLFEE